MEEIIPVTRTEQLLAQAAGMSISAPTPVTRVERLLHAIAMKTGYTEKGKSVNLTLYPSIDAGGVVENKRLINLVSGQKYTVKVDLVIDEAERIFPTTECVCVDLSVEVGQVSYIGNISIIFGEEMPNTGEWFCICESMNDEGCWATVAVYDFANNGGMTLPVVVSEAETVHTIDPKYLPEGGVGYTEGGKVVLNAALAPLDADELGMAVSGYAFYSDVPIVEAGKRYLVTTDSGTTECVAVQVGDSVFLGNMGALGGANTGESFLVGCMFGGDEYKIEAVDFNSGTHMTISETETIHKIDPMYMTEAMPKVIDLDAFGLTESMLAIVADGGGAENVDAIAVNGNAFWDEVMTNRPLMVVFKYNAVRVSVNAVRVYFGDTPSEGEHAAIIFEAPIFEYPNMMRVTVQLGHQSSANQNSVSMAVKVIVE